jgi:ubiquinone/menaquinone biosynthesis C-methylase UbiE
MNDKSGYYNIEERKLRKKIKNRSMWKTYKKSIEEILHKNQRITNTADFGCGIGNITYELSSYPKIENIFGIDFLKETFKIALENKEKFKKVSFIQGDILNIPFKDNKIDLTICLNVLHHIHPKDINTSVNELARITKKTMMIEIRNKNNIFNFCYNKSLTNNRYKKLPNLCQSIKEIDYILEKQDFKLLSIKGRYPVKNICRRLVLTYEKI